MFLWCFVVFFVLEAANWITALRELFGLLEKWKMNCKLFIAVSLLC